MESAPDGLRDGMSDAELATFLLSMETSSSTVTVTSDGGQIASTLSTITETRTSVNMVVEQSSTTATTSATTSRASSTTATSSSTTATSSSTTATSSSTTATSSSHRMNLSSLNYDSDDSDGETFVKPTSNVIKRPIAVVETEHDKSPPKKTKKQNSAGVPRLKQTTTKTDEKREEAAVKKAEREKLKSEKLEKKEQNGVQRQLNKCLDADAEQFVISRVQEGFMNTVDREFGGNLRTHLDAVYLDGVQFMVESSVNELENCVYWQRRIVGVDEMITEPTILHVMTYSDITRIIREAKTAKEKRILLENYLNSIINKCSHPPSINIIILRSPICTKSEDTEVGYCIEFLRFMQIKNVIYGPSPINVQYRVVSNVREVADVCRYMHRSLARAPLKTSERLTKRGVAVIDGQVRKANIPDNATDDKIRVGYWRAMLQQLPGVKDMVVEGIIKQWQQPAHLLAVFEAHNSRHAAIQTILSYNIQGMGNTIAAYLYDNVMHE